MTTQNFNLDFPARIKIDGMTKTLLAEGVGNEKVISWSRHQMVVTKQKDDEISSGSIYGLFDGLRPVVDFSTFYADNETIVDEVRLLLLSVCSKWLQTLYCGIACRRSLSVQTYIFIKCSSFLPWVS